MVLVIYFPTNEYCGSLTCWIMFGEGWKAAGYAVFCSWHPISANILLISLFFLQPALLMWVV